jgi:hypothetical protein
MAGGWATTLLDPLPDRMEAGHSYTVGFWILQHGSHVSKIALSDPGLRFVDDKNQTLVFKGAPLPEGGHYATAIVLPHDGDWAILGMQAPFQDYKVGVLSVPGRLVVSPTPQPIPWPPDQSWSTVRPPSVTAEAGPTVKAAPVKQATKEAPSPPTLPWVPLGIGVLLGLTMSAGALVAGRLSRRLHLTVPVLRPPHP